MPMTTAMYDALKLLSQFDWSRNTADTLQALCAQLGHLALHWNEMQYTS